MFLMVSADQLRDKKQTEIAAAKEILVKKIECIEKEGFTVHLLLKEKKERLYDEFNIISNTYSGNIYSCFEKRLNKRINSNARECHKLIYYEIIVKPSSHKEKGFHSNICLCYKIIEYKEADKNKYKVFKSKNGLFAFLYMFVLHRLKTHSDPFAEDIVILLMRVFFPFCSGSVANNFHKRNISWIRPTLYLIVLLTILIINAYYDTLLFFN